MTPLEERFRIPGGSLDLDDEEEVVRQSSSTPSALQNPSPPQVQFTISHLNATQLSHILSSIPHPLAPMTAEYTLALNISGNAFRTLDKEALAILANHDTAMTEELARVKEGVFPLSIQIDEASAMPPDEVPPSSPSSGAPKDEDVPPSSSTMDTGGTTESSPSSRDGEPDASDGGETDVRMSSDKGDAISEDSQGSDSLAHADAPAPTPPSSQAHPDTSAAAPTESPPTSTSDSPNPPPPSSEDSHSSQIGSVQEPCTSVASSIPTGSPQSTDVDPATSPDQANPGADDGASSGTSSPESLLHSDGGATTPSNSPPGNTDECSASPSLDDAAAASESGQTTESRDSTGTTSTIPPSETSSLAAEEGSAMGPSGSPASDAHSSSHSHSPPPAQDELDAASKIAAATGEEGYTTHGSPDPGSASTSGPGNGPATSAGTYNPIGEDKAAGAGADSEPPSTSGEDSASPSAVPEEDGASSGTAGGVISTGEGGTANQIDCEPASASAGGDEQKDPLADNDGSEHASTSDKDSEARAESSSPAPLQNTDASSETVGAATGATSTSQGGIASQTDSESVHTPVGGAGEDSTTASNDQDTAADKDGTTDAKAVNEENMTHECPIPTGGDADAGSEDSVPSSTISSRHDGSNIKMESKLTPVASTPSTASVAQNIENVSAAHDHTDDTETPSSNDTSGNDSTPAPPAEAPSDRQRTVENAAGEQSRTASSSGDEEKPKSSVDSSGADSASGSPTATPTSSSDGADAVSGNGSSSLVPPYANENVDISNAALDGSDSGAPPWSNDHTESATECDDHVSSGKQPPSGSQTSPVEPVTPPTPSPSTPISTPSASLGSTTGTPTAPPTVFSPDNGDGSFLDFNLLHFSPFLHSGADLPRDDPLLFKDSAREFGPHLLFGSADNKSRVHDTSADSPSTSVRSFNSTVTISLGEGEEPAMPPHHESPSSRNGQDQPNSRFAKFENAGCSRSTVDEDGDLSSSVAGQTHDRSCTDIEAPLETDETAPRPTNTPDDEVKPPVDETDHPVHPPQLKLSIPVSPHGLQDELSLLSPLFSPIGSSTADYSEWRDSSVATSAVERIFSEASFSVSRSSRRAPVKLKRGRRDLLHGGPLAGSESSLISNEPIRVYADAGVQTNEDVVEDQLRRRVKALERELRSLRGTIRRSEEHAMRESKPKPKPKPRSFLEKLAATDRIVPTREPVFGLFKDVVGKLSAGPESSS